MKYLKLLLMVVLCFSFATILFAREETVEATGTAYYEGNNISKAYDDALINAQVKAIQQGCGVNLSSVVTGKDFVYVTEVLTSNTSGRIIKYNEIDRKEINKNNVSITIKATVTNSDPKAIPVNATGYCVIEGNNISDAQKGAFTEAKKQAVERVCGVNFEAKTTAKNFTEVDEILQSYTKGYISEYDVSEEKTENGNYCVKIKAYVKKVDEEIKNIKTVENIENKYCKIENNKLLAYTGFEKIVKIPNSVYSIEADVFSNNNVIEEVILPDTIVSIGNGAFRNCKNLKKINLIDNISYIGSKCFSGCSFLENVNIPKSLNCIEESCFNSCINLTSININNVKILKAYAFAGCYKISNITLDEVEKLEECAFACFDEHPNKSLRKLVIPGSVKTIGKSAFQCYLNIEELIIENGVEEIKDKAFLNLESTINKNLKKLTIPSSVEIIGDYAFQNHPNIEELIIENGVKRIEYGAFACFNYSPNKSLKKLIIPNSVEVINTGAFQCYSNIEELIIENGVKRIEEGAFQNVEATANKSLKKLVIPSSVETIGAGAFQYYSNIEELIIENGVKKIEKNAFLNSPTTINKSLKKLFIPGSVETIGENAFQCYSNLEELIIENGVKKIEKAAFINIETTANKSLKKLLIPGSVEVIGEGAFQFCEGLREVSISRRTKIHNNTFAGCPNVKFEYRD